MACCLKRGRSDCPSVPRAAAVERATKWMDEGRGIALTEKSDAWEVIFFLIVTKSLCSKAQVRTSAPPQNPAGGFYENSAKLDGSSNLLWMCVKFSLTKLTQIGQFCKITPVNSSIGKELHATAQRAAPQTVPCKILRKYMKRAGSLHIPDTSTHFKWV